MYKITYNMYEKLLSIIIQKYMFLLLNLCILCNKILKPRTINFIQNYCAKYVYVTNIFVYFTVNNFYINT